MPSYKLTYFNGQGRAEVPRMLFKLAGIDFEDVRLTREEWQKIKPTSPFGQLPMLEFDGKVLCQSVAISYYLAKLAGLAGESDFEQSRALMVGGCIEDCFPPFYKTFSEQDQEKKKEMRKAYCTETLPPFLEKLENILKSNGTDFFLGNKITWPDLGMYQLVAGMKLFDFMENFPSLEKYPKLANLVEKVEKHPKLSAYIQQREKTSF